jgi:hypothetical protein
MPTMPPEELQAKAIIAAALIQSREVDVTVQALDGEGAWSHHVGLRRLHLLTNLVFDAISSPRL